MSKIRNILLVFVFLDGCQLADAQPYHHDFSNSRVIQQNKNGLFHSDSSYISPGTLSQSAQGNTAGMTTDCLPDTHLGTYVRKVGDDMYNGNNGTMRNKNGSLVYKDEIDKANQIAALRKMKHSTPVRPQLRQVSKGNYYVPGSNRSCSGYGSGASSYSVEKVQKGI